MKKKLTILVAVFALTAMLFTPALLWATHCHTEHKGEATPESPLLEEMAALDKAFQEIVSAVAVGDPDRVLEAVKPLHGKMETTQEALHAGHVELTRNADKMEEFVRMDKEFHMELSALERAASRGDTDMMLDSTGKLLGSCVACHKMFR